MFCCVYLESLCVAFWCPNLYSLEWINKKCNLEDDYMGTWRYKTWFAFFLLLFEKGKKHKHGISNHKSKKIDAYCFVWILCISKVTCLRLLICCIVARCILNGIINVYQPWTSLMNGRINSLNEMCVMQINWFESIANLYQLKLKVFVKKEKHWMVSSLPNCWFSKVDAHLLFSIHACPNYKFRVDGLLHKYEMMHIRQYY
jgi:hypothetical protein